MAAIGCLLGRAYNNRETTQMAKEKTGKAAASAAAKVLRSKSASKAAKSAAASALAQRETDRKKK